MCILNILYKGISYLDFGTLISTSSRDVPLHYSSYLVVRFQVCLTSPLSILHPAFLSWIVS